MVATEARVLTYRQFTVQGGYDVDMSHDRLRFPHGISKRQARDNRDAARHHLGEAVRAMRDYSAAVASGDVRPPNEHEEKAARVMAHPDHESVKATWRVLAKRKMRSDGIDAAAAVRGIVAQNLGGVEPWANEFGLQNPSDVAQIVSARLQWMGWSV